jgi:hypothetical protein
MTGAMIGTGQQICDLRVDVPVESERAHRELLAELEYVGTTSDEAEAGKTRSRRSRPCPGARPLLAAGGAFLVPGRRHFHARRPWTGLVVARRWCAAGSLSPAFRACTLRSGAEMLFAALIALVLADSIGGRTRVDAGEPRHSPGAIAPARARLRVARVRGRGGRGVATVPATPRWLLARKLARFDIQLLAGLLCASANVIVMGAFSAYQA